MSILMTKREAAAYLGIHVDTFEEHVFSSVPRVKIGARYKFKREDLDEWVESQRVGPSESTVESGTYVSHTKVSVSKGQREKQILEKLRKKQLKSTQTTSTIKGAA